MSSGAADWPGDWTTGRAAIVYQQCRACGYRWYFRRGFCPRCGSSEVSAHDASGRGIVHAATLVSRAPSDALRRYVPYLIILIDAEEGFRLMAHGSRDLAIGDAVTARFETFDARLIPFFERRA